MRMADIVTEMYALFTNCTFCHEIAPPYDEQACDKQTHSNDILADSRDQCKANLEKNEIKLVFIYISGKNGYNTFSISRRYSV